MTRLDEIKARAEKATHPDNLTHVAPVRFLITKADADWLVSEVERLRMRCSDLKLALGDSAGWFDRFTSMQAERDARPDAATVEKVREVLQGMLDEPDAKPDWDGIHEALRLLEGKT